MVIFNQFLQCLYQRDILYNLMVCDIYLFSEIDNILWKINRKNLNMKIPNHQKPLQKINKTNVNLPKISVIKRKQLKK
jgi:hypothetical protein